MKWTLVILALVVTFFFEEFYRYMICRNSSRLFEKLFDSKGHEPEYYIYREKGKEKMESLEQDVFTIQSARGQNLKGFYYSNGSRGKVIAFCVHGYRSDHADTGGICYDYYKSRGIDFFCCDHTAHGQSEGHFIGFDVLESEDCLLWLNFLIKKFGPDVQIILHGFSMGGATVMQMSSRCPKNVKFIVEDSGFSNARASLAHQIGPLYQSLWFLNRIIAGYNLDKSDVRVSLAQSRLPILFVHGQDDKLVPYEIGPMLYEDYEGPKDCFFPENTRHIESMYTQPEAYAAKLDEFCKKYLARED